MKPYAIPLSLDGGEILLFEAPASHGRRSGWATYRSDRIDQMAGLIHLQVGPRDRQSTAPLIVHQLRLAANGPRVLSGSTILRAFPWERIEAAVNQPAHRRALADITLYGEPDHAELWAFDWPRVQCPPPDLHLDIPDGYRKPDSFYADVAERFLQAGARPFPGIRIRVIHRFQARPDPEP